MPTAPARPELLAPAGSPEAAYAAFRYGADAIYCGLRRFSARAEALNFSLEELCEVVGYAHRLPRPRRVFVALNTLAASAELPEAAESIASIAEAGADALILQDAGLARLARDLAPTLERHASTQLAIHNLEGARAARAQGFAQVTLARELTFDEVRAIAADGLRTEVFIHGALCYSYSGLCLMSSHRHGRSGNRGRCAYPCRDRYRLAGTDSDGLAFSMKDLALGTDVRTLADAGVACLKIEGRMKSALYVASVTDFYRRILDGTLTREADIRAAEQDLQTVFSRPWTRLYAHAARQRNVIDPDVTGHRGTPVGTVQAVTRGAEGSRWLRFVTDRELQLHDGLQLDLPEQDRPYGFALDRFAAAPSGKPVFVQPAQSLAVVELPPDAPVIAPGATVYCASSQAVKQRFATPLPPAAERKARRPVDVTVRLTATAVEAEARTVDGLCRADARTEGTYTPAKDAARMRLAVSESFAKLGETEFSLHALEIDNPDGLFVPVSHLNALRRDLCDHLAALCAATFAQRISAARISAAPPARVPADTAERWIIRTDQPDCLAGIDDADEVILDLAAVTDAQLGAAVDRFGHARLRLALPTIARGWETGPLAARIAALAQRGHTRWLATNLSAWSLLPPGTDFTVDWTLASLNGQAVAAWCAAGACGVTLSPEDTRANLKSLLQTWGDLAAVVLYQDTPVMISEACPTAALGASCDRCGGDAAQTLQPVRGGDAVHVLTHHCRATLYSARPFALSDRLEELRAAGGRVWRVDFALRRYSADEAAAVWRTVRAGQRPRDTHAGNWAGTL